MNICPPCKKLVHSRSVEGAAGSMRRGFTLFFYGLVSLIAMRPGEFASDRGKARFSTKLRPQQLTDTIAVSCFWLGMVIHRFCDPSVLSCGFDQLHHAGTRGLPQLKATLRVNWIRPTRTEAEELRWMIPFLNRQLRKKHPYVTSRFLSRGVARVQPKAAL